MEAAVKDFKRIAQEHSVTSSNLIFAKEDIAKLTAELDALKAKYQDAEFNFKKFDVSSTVVETMIEKQLRFKNQDKDKKGLGYNSVPPPFNDNYTPPLETSEFEPFSHYGKSHESSSVNSNNFDHANVSNVSASCADEKPGEDGYKKDDDESVDDSSKTNASAPSESNADSVSNGSDDIASKPSTSLNNAVKCACTCACGNKGKQKTKRTKSKSKGPGPNPNHPPLKKQTCFNCGVPGHIARNCPHRPYVPYYAQHWHNGPSRRSRKRNPSRPRSSDGNWNEDKAKRQKAALDKLGKQHDTRGDFIKPTWVRPKSSQGSCSSTHLEQRLKAKGNLAPKSSVAAPNRSKHPHVKPDYRWVPKGSKSNKCPDTAKQSISDNQVMSWESVTTIGVDGKPNVKKDWVSKRH